MSIRSFVFFLFFIFCVFLYIIIYTLHIARTIKRMTVNEIRESVFENYYKGIGRSTESSSYLVKSLKTKEIYCPRNANALDSLNAKEHYQSFSRK